MFSFQNEGYLIVLIFSILITCLLVSTLIFLTSRYWKNSFCFNKRSPALSVSGSNSYLPYLSPSQPQRFGTVGRKLRPHSRPVSGVEDLHWMEVDVSSIHNKVADRVKSEIKSENALELYI